MGHACGGCDRSVDDLFRFCPWCGTPQRSKLVELFRPHPLVEADGGRALRVSRYLAPEPAGRHVRFSVWDGDVAGAAISVDDDEAARLARFLGGATPTAGIRRRSLTDRVRSRR